MKTKQKNSKGIMNILLLPLLFLFAIAAAASCGGGGGGGCGGFIQDSGNKNRDNSSLILSFIFMLIISLTGISLARRVIRA